MIAALDAASGGRLAYHTHPYKVENGLLMEDHTHHVLTFTMQLMQALELANVHLSGYEKGAAMLDAAWHDVYMDFRVALVEMGAGMPLVEKIIRIPRVSEKKSADALAAFMRAENMRICWPIYTPATVILAHRSIMLTVPIFTQNGVEQAITKKTPLAARLVPLADLGEAGLTGNVGTTIRLLCEDYPQIAQALFENSWMEYLEPSLLAAVRGFMDFQERFVIHRESRLTDDLAGLPARAQDALRAQFCHFDEFRVTSQEAAQRVNEMTFPEVVPYLRSLVMQ